jgi:two-component system phosphate regulon sensor histidine kinase PhoR
MRHKTSGYFLLSALLVSLILGLCILLNLRCPQAVSDDALTQEQLTRGVTLTGWQQTGPGHWRFAFEAPADVPELVLCLSTRLLDAVPEGLEPTDQRGEASWVRPVPGRTSEITVTSTTVPQMWLMLPDTLWHWRELRSSLQLMALVAFASMGAGILALFCFKPQHELGVFLLYLGVMFGWGLAVLLPAGQTGALLGFLMGLYFPFAVLTPLWLCCSLLHVALPRRGSRRFALSVLGVLLFLVLGTSTQAVLRNVTLLAGMAAVLVVLARALAKKERPAWYLLAGYILTFALRLTVVLPSFRFWFYRESFPFYMVRCARLYDIPFTLGCLVFVSRRYALQFDRTEQLAQELEARVAQRTQALQNETDARKSMMLNIFHDLRSPLFVIGSGLGGRRAGRPAHAAAGAAGAGGLCAQADRGPVSGG